MLPIGTLLWTKQLNYSEKRNYLYVDESLVVALILIKPRF